jgi:carbon monoxide dehydrogenase subunit G
MIETTQTVIIAAPIGAVWDHARDIRRWAALMPGMQTCEVIDDDNSRWVLKVGVGGLVRTVTVDVHVERWDGPGHVTFRYALQGDPVSGGGTYNARAHDGGTEVDLHVEVNGSGPLAPMWEAMGRPLLPQLARGFAEQLKAAIEAEAGAMPAAAPQEKGLLARLKALWRRIFG